MYPTSLRAATRCTPQCTRVLSARFRGRVNARCPSGVIVIARPAVARSFHRRRAVRTYTHIRMREYPRVGVSWHRYIPAPGTNIIACWDKFIADVPQPFVNVPRLRRKTGARKGRLSSVQRERDREREEGRSESGSLDVSRDISGGRYNEIYAVPRGHFRPCLREHYARGIHGARNREKLSRGKRRAKMRAANTNLLR